jgi:phosphoglycolate phosphatase-like HAD superfamily hydrolase
MKLILFDFDLTITRKHMTNHITKMHMVDKTQKIPDLVNKYLNTCTRENILSDLFLNYDAIQTMFELKRKGDVVFGIVSYGYNAMIFQTLANFNLDQLFNIIMTPANFNLVEGADHTHSLKGKNKMINQIMKMYNITNISDVLFYDDSRANIAYATAKLFRAYIVNEGGLPLYELREIVDFVNKN